MAEPASQNDLLLEVKDLKKHFPIQRGMLRKVVGQVKAVDGVSFFIRRGETYGLVGESGCGKTTIGRCICRAYDPTGGEMLYVDHAGNAVDLVHDLTNN